MQKLIARVARKPLVQRLLTNRWAVAGLLMLLQAQFFVINALNAQLRAPTDGWELQIAAIDRHLTPHGIWLVPYGLGIVLTVLVPLWALLNMPTLLYRQYVFALFTALMIGYAIYIFLPTYVTKPAPQDVPGDGFFARLLRQSYEADAAFSTHNAAPSQHVFYAVLNACFVIRFKPRRRVFLLWTTLATLITASTVLTARHNTPDVITGYALAVLAYYVGLWLGRAFTEALGDAETPPPNPPLRRWLRERWQTHRLPL